MRSSILLTAVALFLSIWLQTPVLVAQPALPTAPSFVLPSLVQHNPPGLCIWTVTVDRFSAASDTSTSAYSTNIPGNLWSYSYSCTAAAGMEIWSDAFAHDELIPVTAYSTVSSLATGSISIQYTPACTNQQPQISLDWNPHFALRTEVCASVASSLTSGLMYGTCTALNTKVEAKGALERSTNTTTGQVGGSVSLAGTGGGVSIPVGFTAGVGATEQQFLDIAQNSRNITSATCVFSGTTSCSVSADDFLFDGSTAEAKAKCFDSKAGLDLNGQCLGCGSQSYALYNYY